MLNLKTSLLRHGSVRAGRLAALAAAFSLLGACGQGASEPALPEASVGEDVAAVVSIDAEAISPANLRASAMALLNAVPDESAQQRQMAEQQFDQSLEQYTEPYNDMFGEGVRAIRIAIAPLDTGRTAGMLLLRTEGDVDLDALRAKLQAFGEQAGQGGMPDDATLEKHDDTWAYFQSPEGDTRSPADGTAEATQAFENAMAQVPGGVKLALRMTNVVEEQAQRMQGAPGPMAMFSAPLQDLDFAVIGVTTGGAPSATAQMQFNSADSAKTFLEAWNGMMSMAKASVSAQMQNAPEPPSSQTLDALFTALEMQQDSQTLSLTLDTPFIENVAKVAPLAAPMLMGGMGGGGMGGGGMTP